MRCNTEPLGLSIEKQVSYFLIRVLWCVLVSVAPVSERTYLQLVFLAVTLKTQFLSTMCRRCKTIDGIGPVLFNCFIFMEIQRKTQFPSEGKVNLGIQIVKHATNPSYCKQTHIFSPLIICPHSLISKAGSQRCN